MTVYINFRPSDQMIQAAAQKSELQGAYGRQSLISCKSIDPLQLETLDAAHTKQTKQCRDQSARDGRRHLSENSSTLLVRPPVLYATIKPTPAFPSLKGKNAIARHAANSWK